MCCGDLLLVLAVCYLVTVSVMGYLVTVQVRRESLTDHKCSHGGILYIEGSTSWTGIFY